LALVSQIEEELNMKSLEDRQKGFEAAFQRDQELAFRIKARRNRLFGLWAAERLGLPAGDAADGYARTVVAADFEAPGDDDVVGKVRSDLAEQGLAITETELRAELSRAAAEARRQLSQP
jgi:hypothetical protein